MRLAYEHRLLWYKRYSDGHQLQQHDLVVAKNTEQTR